MSFRPVSGVRIIGATAAPVSTYPVTLSAWIRRTGNTGAIISLGAAAANDMVDIGLTGSGTPYIETYNAAGGSSFATGPKAATVGQWCHVVGVLASATSRVCYVDGVPGTVDTTSVVSAGWNRTGIGVNYQNSGLSWDLDADIAFPAVWSAALSPAEILELAKGRPAREIRRESLAGRWGEGTGQDHFLDRTGRGTALSFTNTSTVMLISDNPSQVRPLRRTGWDVAVPLTPTAPVQVATTDQQGAITGVDWGIAHSFQRGAFTAAGRDWVIFSKSFGDIYAYITSSSDSGATWSTPAILRDLSDTGFQSDTSIAYSDFCFDGTYFHYAVGGSSSTTGISVLYRRGLPMPDGSIVWSQPEQNAFAGDGSLLELGLSVDTSGHPWLTLEYYGFGYDGFDHPIPWVNRSSTTDGTWVDDFSNSFPVQLSVEAAQWWTGVAPLDTAGKMIIFYWNDDVYQTGNSANHTTFATVWTGTSFTSEITIDTPIRDGGPYGILPTVAYASNPAAGLGYLAWTHSTGTTYCWVGNDSSAAVETVMTTPIPATLALGFDSGTNELLLAYVNGTTLYLKRRSAGGTWGAAQTLATGVFRPDALQITERSGRVIVTYQTDTSTGTDPIYAVYPAYLVAGSSTPITGSDSLALSESAVVTIITNITVSDSLTLSEGASSLAAALSTTESLTFGEAVALSAFFVTTESVTFSEVAAVLAATGISVADSWAVTEATSTVVATLAVSDSLTLSDVSSLAATLDVVDSMAQSEGTTGVSVGVAVTDAQTQSEGATGVDVGVAVTDAQTQSEGTTSIAAAVAVVDSWAVTDAADLGGATQINVTDSFTQSEGATSIAAALNVTDAATFSDQWAGQVALSVSDAFTVADASAILAALGVTDSLTFTDNLVLTDTQYKSVVDAATLNEAASINTGTAAPPIKLPTTTDIGVWAASVLITSRQYSVELSERVLQAVIASNNAKLVVVTGNLGGVDIDPYTATVDVTPNIATVEVG